MPQSRNMRVSLSNEVEEWMPCEGRKVCRLCNSDGGKLMRRNLQDNDE